MKKAHEDPIKAMAILSQLMEALGNINGNEMSKKLGYSSNSSVYNILKGDRSMPISMIDRILKVFPHVNEDYLKEGKTPILISEASETIADRNFNTFNPTFEDVPRILYNIQNLLTELVEQKE